jgi:SnoaL-like polyketide cyclase
MPRSRLETMSQALHATLTADAATCELVFTNDVEWVSPTLTASSRDELETLLSSRADTLADIEVDIRAVEETDDTVLAEWRVTARHVRSFLVNADTGLSAAGESLAMEGSTLARFSGLRISAIHHRFDEEALLAQIRR